MLTPDKIKEKTFQTTGRGSYRSEDVDSFLSEVSSSYERMFKENSDLIKKISILAKKVEEYRAEENSLKMALLNAQKLADSIVADAKESAKTQTDAVNAESEKVRADAAAIAEDITSKAKKEADAVLAGAKAEAEKIVAEANRQSNEILGNINRKVTHESLVYEMIQKEASEFKGKLVSMYKEHINIINKLPELADEKLNSEAAEDVKEEPVAEESEPVVIEKADIPEAVIVDEEPEMEETVEETEEISDIAEEPEAVDADEPVPAEETEEAPADTQESKKPFKLDLSKIDFTSDVDSTAHAPAAEIAVSLDASESSEDDEQHISFKSFFKKKQ